MTVTSSPAGEHADTNLPTPIRHTVDTLNSDALDELYDDRDRLQAQLSDMTRDRNRWKWYRDDAERRVRVQRGRAERAEAAAVRVRKATANSFMAGPNAVDVVRVADVLAALAEPKED
ncbi:hypothetical protein AB0M61_01735 [Streptomyces sp. NPDC051642]|uniref:hypothetical protein n=1 Tax=Streptomyces sp. NPDC051642 TaxID=3154646 RepID=UPI0034474262